MSRLPQCGYCLSGILISAKPLLDRNRRPRGAEIAAALDDNICRSGMLHRVFGAVAHAAARMREVGAAVTVATLHQPVAVPPLLKENPRLDQRVRFETPGRVTVSTGRVEIGQGVLTAMLQIAADELDVSLDRIDLRTGDTTRRSPRRGRAAASRSTG
jgi:Molybdopterin-binding domain of aldehyde dehydrogenase/[2Fe-2S] binding domain